MGRWHSINKRIADLEAVQAEVERLLKLELEQMLATLDKELPEEEFLRVCKILCDSGYDPDDQDVRN